MNKHLKRFLTVMLLLFCVITTLSADDNGSDTINSSLNVVKGIVYSIGGACIVLSIALWAIKGIIKKNIEPRDWQAIVVILACGVLLVIAPTIAKAIVGTGTVNFSE